MSYPRKYPTSESDRHCNEFDWNAMVDRVNGFSPSGVYRHPYTFLIDKQTVDAVDYYMAVSGFQIVYGGPYWDEDPVDPDHSGSGNGVDGTDYGKVTNAALDACALNPYGGLVEHKAGENYELIDPAEVDVSYETANCLKPTLNTILDFNGATLTVIDGINTAILLGSYYIGSDTEIDVENVTIRNGKLRSSANMANGIGFCTEGDSHIKNVVIEDMDMEMIEGSDLNFAGVAAEFSPTSTAASYIQNFIVQRCNIKNIRAAIQIQGITGNDFNTTVKDFHIRDNTFTNCPWGGFWLSKCALENSFIENNRIVDCGTNYAGIFMVPTGAADYELIDVTIQNNKIYNPVTPSDFGIEIESWSKNLKIINNTVSNTVKNPIYLASHHLNTEVAGNILSDVDDSDYALMNIDYDLTMTNISVHDNICVNKVDQKWLLHNVNSPIHVNNNVPSFPLCCTGAADADPYAHYSNNFGLAKVDKGEVTPGLSLGNGVAYKDVTLSAEMQARLYIDVVACAWGYYVTGLTPTWDTTTYISNKTATGFRINFGTVTPDANQIIYYNLKTVV